jgi:hypothetical protein
MSHFTTNEDGLIIAPCCGQLHSQCRCWQRPLKYQPTPTPAPPDAVANVFCPTGPGGGVKPNCSPKGLGTGGVAAGREGGTSTGGSMGGSHGRAKRGSYDKVKARVDRLLQDPSPRNRAGLARALGSMPLKDLARLKRETGIRAGGRKAEQVEKLAAQITTSVSTRVRAEREARSLGHSTAALKHYAKEFRKAHNEQADRVNKLLKEVRKMYQSQNGKPLNRNNPAFNGGDYTKLKGWDSIARQLAGDKRFSDMLHDAGYRGGGRAAETKAYQTLFDLVRAGNAPRMSYKEGYERSLNLLRDMEPTAPVRRGGGGAGGGGRKGKKAQADDEPFDLF